MVRSVSGTTDSLVKVTFWGVRGSIPMSGADNCRYGGHSACVQVSAPGLPALVLDCGTGAKRLGRELLEKGDTEIVVLFSHTHMDHLFALPFFDPIQSPRCSVRLAVPAASTMEARNKIGRYLNGVFHPLRAGELGATVSFQAVAPSTQFNVGEYVIQTLRLVHPGGAIGYRISLGDRSICYLTDTGPFASAGEGLIVDEPPAQREPELVDFVRGSDVLIMDTTFSQEEYLHKMTWGHCYPEYAVKLGEVAEVGEVLLFHHGPDATDDEMDTLAARWESHTAPAVRPAKEGMVVDLSG